MIDLFLERVAVKFDKEAICRNPSGELPKDPFLTLFRPGRGRKCPRWFQTVAVSLELVAVIYNSVTIPQIYFLIGKSSFFSITVITVTMLTCFWKAEFSSVCYPAFFLFLFHNQPEEITDLGWKWISMA